MTLSANGVKLRSIPWVAEVLGVRYSVSFLLSAVWIASLSVIPTFAVSQEITISLRLYPGDLLVVPVMVNGAGPYDFVVDTGSNTTIMEARLFRELGLKAEGTMHLSSMVQQNTQGLVAGHAREVAVRGLAARNLEVLATKDLKIGTLEGHVRGILGENFLDQFDVLIDNEKKQITLDSGDGLASSFEGERLPLSLFSTFQGETVLHRPIVSASVPSFTTQPLRLLVDTGSDRLRILPRKGMMWRAGNGAFSTETATSTMFGVLPCAQWQDTVRLGRRFASYVTVVSCPDATAEDADNEGSLPSGIFRQLLISHRFSYVIANPKKRNCAPQESGAPSSLQ